ncbi:MAG TPA: acyltransferase [Terracidiphilus sp.]|nr:acyltransferase [Terracidiphilus sp.]
MDPGSSVASPSRITLVAVKTPATGGAETAARANRVKRYVPCLEGLRGYGFLLVFCGHYFAPSQLAHPGTIRLKFATAMASMGLFAVPAFFVLSGYLIGGILYDTRHREGFFRVFYTRRILRVFPVFYVTLLAILLFNTLYKVPYDYHFWVHFLYIQNLLPSYIHQHSSHVSMIHFWSLAVEEQFYLLWPLVVWLFPERKKLLSIATCLIAFSCILRIAAPFFIASPKAIVWFTPTRADAILLGVILALIRHDPIYERIKPFAKWVVLAGGATAATLAILKGASWSMTFAGEEIWIPLVNFTSFAIIITVMEEGTLINRLCSQKWICWLGSLSYSLYVFHLTYAVFFLDTVTRVLEDHMRQSFAVLTAGLLAFCLTLLLSIICYLLIERPILNMKQTVRYGPAQAERVGSEVREPVLVRTGA